MTIDQLRSDLTNQIFDEGIVYHWIDAHPDSIMHRDLPWAYTIGRTMRDQPELLVTGLGEAHSKALMAELEGVDGLSPDIPLTTQAAGPVAFIQAETGLLFGAFAVFGTRFTALQVIWMGSDPQPLHPRGGLIMTDPYDYEIGEPPC